MLFILFLYSASVGCIFLSYIEYDWSTKKIVLTEPGCWHFKTCPFEVPETPFGILFPSISLCHKGSWQNSLILWTILLHCQLQRENFGCSSLVNLPSNFKILFQK